MRLALPLIAHSLHGFITVAMILIVARSFPAVAAASSPPDSIHGHAASSTIDDLEDLAEGALGAEMDAELLDRLIWLLDHPIDLNGASEEDFFRIPGVPSADVEALQRYRRTHGRFKEAFDLAGVPGVSSGTWRLLRPFVTVSPPARALVDLRMRCDAPVRQVPATDTAYLGSDVSSYGRVILSPSRGWECGVVAASDAGERLADGFLSGYVKYESAGLLRKAIAGDFSASAGAGLMWGQGMRLDGLLADRNASFSPHRSSGEQGFLRGIGFTAAVPIRSGELRAHLLVSRTSCSATLDSNNEITSLSATSTYRTGAQLGRRNAGELTSLGARVEILGTGNVRIGLTGAGHWFDHSIRGEGFSELDGRDFKAIGVDGAVTIGPVRCAGEYACAGRGSGYVATLAGSGGHDSEVQILLRHCAPDFHSPLALGGSYGDLVRNTNEVRWSVGLSPLRNLSLRAEITQFRKLSRTATTPFPTGGREILVEGTLRWIPGFQVTFRGEERWTEHRLATPDGQREGIAIIAEPRRRIQCTGNLTRGSRWQMRGRFELVRFLNKETGTDESGWMVMGDIRWDPAPWLRVSLRMTLYKTDSYASRIYSIESTSEGLSGSTLLNGTGRRWYCLVISKPIANMRISARYVSTDTMSGIHRTRTESQLTAQVDFQIAPPLE
jgi:hypothetical protein